MYSTHGVQFVKYFFVGVLNTGVYYAVYYIMLKLGSFYVVAHTAGTAVGIINSYFWNKYYAFRSKKKSIGEVLRFLSVYAVQYFCNLMIIRHCVVHMGISAELAGIAAVVVGIFISYFGHKFWTFR